MRFFHGIFLLIAVLFLFSCSTKPEEPSQLYTRRTQADSLLIQGFNQSDRLNFSPAKASFNQALNIYASLDNREGMVNALLALGRISRLEGDAESAEEFYLHAELLAGYSEDPKVMRSVLNHLADLSLRQGDPVKAMDYLEDRKIEVSSGRERAAQLRLRGSAEHAMGAEDAAAALLTEAAEIAEAADAKIEAAQAYYKLASIASLGARFEDAENWALKALEADKSREYSPGIAADLRALAIISVKSGNNKAAEDYYMRSWLAWRALGHSDDAELARIELENLSGRPVTVP